MANFAVHCDDQKESTLALHDILLLCITKLPGSNYPVIESIDTLQPELRTLVLNLIDGCIMDGQIKHFMQKIY